MCHARWGGRLRWGWAILAGIVLSGAQPAAGQIAGSRWNEEPAAAAARGSDRLPPEVALKYIAVPGTAQRRVVPTELRLVWAIAVEAPDAPGSLEQLRQRVQHVSEAWRTLGVAEPDIIEDFISAIPRYEWLDENRGGTDLLVEKQTGYRVQTNIHVRVADPQQALRVIDAALAAGVTDLIGVDYLADLEAVQLEASQAALEAARQRSGRLLPAIFSEPPLPINVTETTRVHLPPELYASFENVASETYQSGWDDRKRRLYAYRPKNTYYRGWTEAADDRTYTLPMQPEIVVESTVQLYYLSPAALKLEALESEERSKR